MPDSPPAKALVGLRTAVGVSSWLTPGLAGKAFGLSVKDNPQSPYLARLFGVRDVALAAGAAGSSGPARKLWWQIGIACDALDVAAALLAGRSGHFSKASTVLLAGTAASAAGLGVAALMAEDAVEGDPA